MNLIMCQHAPILEEKGGLPADCATVPYIHPRYNSRDNQQGNQEGKYSKWDELGRDWAQNKGNGGGKKLDWVEKDLCYARSERRFCLPAPVCH